MVTPESPVSCLILNRLAMAKAVVLMTLATFLSAMNSCRGMGRRRAFSLATNRHEQHMVRSKGSFAITQKTTSSFQFHHRYFSEPALAATTRYTTPTVLWLSSLPNTKSELVTISESGQISPEKEYVLCFHGRSSAGKTDGVAGSGMVLYDDSDEMSELWWGRQCLGNVTLNEAEYITLVTALECARSLGVQHIKVQGHNQLILKQMEGTNKVKSPTLKEHYERAVALRKEFASFTISLVDKSLNDRAIGLAKEAIAHDINTLDNTRNGPIDRNNDDENTAISSQTLNDIDNFTPGPTTTNDAKDVSQELDSTTIISPEKTYVLRFDGGSRGNPGTAGAGMVLYDSEYGVEIWSGYQYLGETNTNNEAEYMGLITGLQCARSLGIEHLVAQGDSQLILRQLEGRYKVNSPNLKAYYDEAVSLSKEFASFQTSHIERARNARADELANEAMDTKSTRGFDLHG